VPHTALRAATAIGNEAIIRLLVQREAKVINEDAYSCGICRFRTPLYNATQRGDGAIITLLVENCADINAKDHNGDSVFLMEIQIGNQSIIRLLIENGADIYAKDRYGKSMLHTAILGGNKPIVRLLVDVGAEITCEAIDTGRSTAVSYGLESIDHFLTKKSNPAASQSKSPPRYAIELELKHRLDLNDVEDSSEQDTPSPQKRMRLINRPGED
jgi:hypothetical protein